MTFDSHCKGMFTRSAFQSVIENAALFVQNCVNGITNRMGLLPILSIIHTVTIDTILNKNHCVINNGLKNATCKHSLNECFCCTVTSKFYINTI